MVCVFGGRWSGGNNRRGGKRMGGFGSRDYRQQRNDKPPMGGPGARGPQQFGNYAVKTYDALYA